MNKALSIRFSILPNGALEYRFSQGKSPTVSKGEAQPNYEY
jgi:hypothetical protein